MRYTCECGSSFERWDDALGFYVCANCGTLWEPDIQPASLAEVAVIEAEYQDSRFDDDDEWRGYEYDEDYEETGYYPCSCPYCMCSMDVYGGGVCGDCYSGAHQG